MDSNSTTAKTKQQVPLSPCNQKVKPKHTTREVNTTKIPATCSPLREPAVKMPKRLLHGLLKGLQEAIQQSQ